MFSHEKPTETLMSPQTCWLYATPHHQRGNSDCAGNGTQFLSDEFRLPRLSYIFFCLKCVIRLEHRLNWRRFSVIFLSNNKHISRKLPKIRQRPLPSAPFPIQYWLNIRHYRPYSKLLRASLNRPCVLHTLPIYSLPNIILLGTGIRKLLITYFSPGSSHVLPYRSKYTPRPPPPQPVYFPFEWETKSRIHTKQQVN
jgi:hypothetical protein